MNKGTIVSRKLHKLSKLADKQIAKMFRLYERPYLVTNVHNNAAELHRIVDGYKRKEILDNLKVYIRMFTTEM